MTISGPGCSGKSGQAGSAPKGIKSRFAGLDPNLPNGQENRPGQHHRHQRRKVVPNHNGAVKIRVVILQKIEQWDRLKRRKRTPYKAPNGEPTPPPPPPPPEKEDHGGGNCPEKLPGPDAVPDPFTHQKGHAVEDFPADIGHHADGVFPVHRPGLPVPKPAQGRGQFPAVLPQFHRSILRLIRPAPGRLFRAFPQG